MIGLHPDDRFAIGVLLRRSRGAAVVTLLLGPAGWRDFARVYAYFRLWDDRVDVPGRVPGAARDALAAEAEARRARRPGSPEGRALASALAARPQLGEVVERMWSALEADDARGPAPMPAEWLDEQAARIGDSYADALWICGGQPGPTPWDARALARAATRVHWLRDREEDAALGYCNVPAELESSDVDGWIRAEAFRLGWVLGDPSSFEPRRLRWVFDALARRYSKVAFAIAGPWDTALVDADPREGTS